MNVDEKYKKVLLDIVAQHLPVCKVYLFGSRARGTQRSGSDIDLALDAYKKIDDVIIMNIKEAIDASLVPFFVDIIDLHDVSQDFKDFITKDLIVWKN